MLFVQLTIIYTTITFICHACDYYLYQTDFSEGTYRIRNNGTYCIEEDISFNPVPGSKSSPNEPGAWFPIDDTLFPGSVTQHSGAFALGFFAMIAIETSNVIINLQGHSLVFSQEFYLQQRWGAIIEIANSPFLPDVGPADFGQDFEYIQDITIKNGVLGLTSHHGIHSNGAKNILIEDLVIEDFEVGGIQLNGFQGATFHNLQIGPSLDNVPLTGYYSNGRFILLALRQLLDAIVANSLSVPRITFAGSRSLTLEEIEYNLVESMDLVYKVLTKIIKNEKTIEENENYIAGKKLFVNEEELPDGSAIYGILLNSNSLAINGFGDSENESDDQGKKVTINGVTIDGLKLNANEIPALYFDKCYDESSETNTIQKGPFGDIFDLRKVVSDTDAGLIELHGLNSDILSAIEYIGNPLADAQIALADFASYVDEQIGDGSNYGFGSVIDQDLIDWAKGDIPFPSDCADFVCNGDIMFHVNKGIVGLRMDGIEDVTIIDLCIRNLWNESPYVSNACGNYSGPHDGGSPGTEEKEGGMGTDIRGISISDGDVYVIGDNLVRGLNSYYGDTTGISLMDGAILDFDIGSDIRIKQIKSASRVKTKDYEELVTLNKTPYPNNFDLCTINIEDESIVSGQVPEDKLQSDCLSAI